MISTLNSVYFHTYPPSNKFVDCRKRVVRLCVVCRTIWTDEECYNNNEYFASRRAQQAENLEASGLAPAEYNLEHSDLGYDINKRIKKQENDISHIQTTLEGLLPPFSTHTRYDHDQLKNLSSSLSLILSFSIYPNLFPTG
jgi:hypothetical protein